MIFVVSLLELISLFIVVALFAYVLIDEIHRTSKQKRCKHETYWENRACHAICNSCGKDLGFIGTVREQRSNERNTRAD
jgi:uncharacterized membrane protein